MKTFNLVIGMLGIFYGIFVQDNILVTIGCMNVILARFEVT